MGFKLPVFAVPGVVAESRELKTKEGKVWAYAVKVMAMGGTFDLITNDEAVFKRVVKGEVGEARGHFDVFKGQVKFMLDAWLSGEGEGVVA